MGKQKYETEHRQIKADSLWWGTFGQKPKMVLGNQGKQWRLIIRNSSLTKI